MCNFVRFGDCDVLMLVSSDGRDRVLFAGAVCVYRLAVNGAAELLTSVTLENGRAGTLILRDDGVEFMEFPDGSRRRVDRDPFESSRRICSTRYSRSMRTRTGVSVVHAPKMSREAIAAGEDSDRYQTEGRAKAEAMTMNARVDLQTNTVMGISHDYSQPGAARNHYGRRVECLASV